MLSRLLVLVALLTATIPGATAAVLIEASAPGGNLRLVIDRDAGRVLVNAADFWSLVDLRGGDVYLEEDEGVPRRFHVRYRPGHDAPPPYRLEPFAPGPMIAGHASRYHVLFVEDRVCAEVLVSGWMRPFVDPAVQALALLDRIKGERGGDACADIPFPTLAAAGWPLLSGKIDAPTFETLSIRFDYEPKPGELALPEIADDAPLTEAEAISLPGGA